MNSSIKKNKIIWSFDPTQNPKEAKNLIKEIRTWARHLNCDVQPVSIVSNSALNFPVKLATPWKDKLQEFANISASNYLKKAHAKGFLPAELVYVPTVSNRKMASEMAKYAEKKDAQLIFVNTRAKKTWNPFRLGGFAETLVATSRVPVLLLNPSSIPSTRISSILFPTDFSSTSKKALSKLESWTKALNSKIFLYDQIESPTLYPSEISGLGLAQLPYLESRVMAIEKSRLKKGTAWSNHLEKQGIKNLLLVQKQRNDLATDILEVAKKNKTNLIAIASQCGPVSQALLGSVARDILLQAKCPVLIFYRPKAARKYNYVPEQKPEEKYLPAESSSIQTEIQHQ